MTPLKLAILFHETYERLAPEYTYTTREDTRKFNPLTPNGRLMVAVCTEILGALLDARALKVLYELFEVHSIGDYVYDIREREALGWDGPGVKAWGDLCDEARSLLDDNPPV